MVSTTYKECRPLLYFENFGDPITLAYTVSKVTKSFTESAAIITKATAHCSYGNTCFA
ncbi:MAG: alpha/beta hydrolase [Nitrospinae bacterium]|nr:alpha/beta hydrolase [Nitrospinota bacterium]